MKVIKSVFILSVAIAISVGCATDPPIKNPQILKSNLPQEYSIKEVPIYQQGYNECGPTSLRMVMNFYGRNLTKEDIAEWILRARGTSSTLMEFFARKEKFEVCAFYDWKKGKMKYLLAQGYPLIVLGVPPSNWPVGRYITGAGHFTVVVGYDDNTNYFSVHDPGTGKEYKVPYEVFKEYHSSHPTESNYVLCIYPKWNRDKGSIK
jgi:ABC-type bacteriocin/lantibiotic exporter with double-glycine peptidase domain